MKTLKRIWCILVLVSAPFIFYDTVYLQNSATVAGIEFWRIFTGLFCANLFLDSLSDLLQTFIEDGYE